MFTRPILVYIVSIKSLLKVYILRYNDSLQANIVNKSLFSSGDSYNTE